jgi:hypothetical protein
MSKRHLYFLAGFLCVIGVGFTLIRVFVLEFPLLPQQTVETWRVETRVQFEAANKPVRVEMKLPLDTPGMTAISESFVAAGYGRNTRQRDDNRFAVFTKRKAEGRQVLLFQTVIRRTRSAATPPAEEPTKLERATFTGARLDAARALADEIDGASADNRSFQNIISRRLANDPAGGGVALLLGDDRSSRNVARTAVQIMALANIPAREVHGFKLIPDRRGGQLTHWTEVFDQGAWVPFDPETGLNRTPADTVTWWRGSSRFLSVQGGEGVSVEFAVRRTFEFALRSAIDQQRALNKQLIDFSVFGLPLQTQEIYRVLFVLPFGILLIALLRNVVGIKTIGTFMPVLIALGFRDTGLVWGIILFGIVVLCGLAVRAYMEQLKLLMVPRLATVATVVIILMAVLSIISFNLGVERGLSIGLFPIVILTMAIERISTIWEEWGGKEALHQAGGSLFVAILAFVLMNWTFLQHFIFVFPEFLLVVLAALVLLGRYSGYRLTELPRFKVLAGK